MKEYNFNIPYETTNTGALKMLKKAETIGQYYNMQYKDILPVETKSFMELCLMKHKYIKESCEPQEVYCYEYNNHECQYSWNGDYSAIEIIIDIWGKEIAHKINRTNAVYSIDEIFVRPTY